MKDTQREQLLLTMVVNQILRNSLTEESASSRMKQVALMTVIYTCIPLNSVVSLSDLGRITGLTRAGIIETIEPLVRRGLLIETTGKNSMGRARRVISRLLHPRSRPLQRCRALAWA